MKKITYFILCIILVITLVGCGDKESKDTTKDDGKTYKMTIGTTVQDDSSVGVAMLDYFKPYVEKHSDGRIKVEVQNNSVLGSDREIFEAVQLNTVQGSQGPLSTLANFDEDFAVCDLPFLFRSKDVAYKNLDGKFGKKMAKKLPDNGMRILAYGENAFRNISNNSHPVKTADDLNGLKIRVMESPINIATYKAMGTNPTPMAFSELYSALSQGAVQGQDNGVVLTYTNKLYEVQPYYTFTNHIYAANAVVVSEQFWQSLPKDLQKVLKDASKYSMKKQRELNEQMEKDLVKKMEDEGVEFIKMDSKEVDKLVKSTKGVWKTVNVDPDLMDMAKSIRDNKDK